MKQINLKDRKVLFSILCIVLICVFTLTVAYAALNAVLNISGSAQVNAANWDIHLENPNVISGSVSNDKPTITSPTTATFTTTLNTPGDYYEFTIDVVNNGSVDAMIENITKTPTLTTDQAKYLKYEITYQNGEQITTKQLVSKNSYVRLKVRVEFRKDLSNSDLPKTSETLNLGLKLDYIQSDGTGSSVSDNGVAKIVTAEGDINEIGTIVTIGTEKFYTIGTEGNNVKLLSMMNITLDDNPVQSETAGTTAFSNSQQKGTYYSDYNGSIVEVYVNKYKNSLEQNNNITIEKARIISEEEITNTNTFNCMIFSSCSTQYPWIYSTNYWTGAVETENDIYAIRGNTFNSEGYHIISKYGVRPVIVINKNLILSTMAQTITFTINQTSYQAEQGMSWEEWVNSDYNKADVFIEYNSVKLDGKCLYGDGNYEFSDSIIKEQDYYGVLCPV